MPLTISSHDIIYIALWIISIASIFFTFRGKLTGVEKDMLRLERILLGASGALNIIDQKTCLEHRNLIFDTIRRTEITSCKSLDDYRREVDKTIIKIHKDIEETKQTVDRTDKNMIKMMIYMKLEGEDNDTST